MNKKTNPSAVKKTGRPNITPAKILIALLSLAVAGLAIFCIVVQFMTPKQAAQPQTHEPEVIVKEVEKEVEKLVEVKRQITADIIQDGIRKMGFLLTGEYYFTEVITDQKSQSFANLFSIPVASYAISYDGVITAGIDFNQVKVYKDDEFKTIRIRLPKAQIKNIDVDPESFTLISEKESILYHYSMEEYNDALIALEEKAQAKAIDRGLLTKAYENAKDVVSRFVESMMEEEDYKITFINE